MNIEIPFFNLSLRKVLRTEPFSFERAKIKILYTLLIFSIVKTVLVLSISIPNNLSFQTSRAAFALGVYIVMLKLLLSGRQYYKVITHILIWTGLLIIWSTIFISAHAVNIVVLQFVFMLLLSAFYLLNVRMGLIYSVLACLPVIIFVIDKDIQVLQLAAVFEPLPSPGAFILVFLNFLTVIVAHYLYHQAFKSNLDEKTALNVRLKTAVQDANELARTKSDFLSVMSHELRTPLNSVIGMTELLLDEPANPQQKENLKILRFSALSLHTLINDILDFNKLDSNKIHLETISINLAELVKNICSGLEIQSNEKGLKLLTEIDKELQDINVFSDPTRLSQIIYNLAGNGIKFTSRGYVKVSLKVLNKSSEALRVMFLIEDTGIGISPEKQEIIFEPFVQASTNTTRNFGGTGLGLSIVKRLLKLFSSEIHVKSSEGEGSRFFFELEFKVDKESIAGKSQVTDLNTDLSGLKVMIAEDNPMNVFLVKKLCNKWKIEPVIAENGQLAIEKLKQADFDIVLMDIHMPVLNGFDATRLIRQMADPVKSSVHIIAITASVSQDLAEKVKEAGMNDFISKPFDHRDLYQKLQRVKRKESQI